MSTRPSYRLLIVDDDDGVREGLVDYLTHYHEADYELVIDASPDAATARRQVAGKHYDLVITDINLPGEDGFSLIAHLREATPRTRTALITAYQVEDYVRNALRTGVCNIIAKTAPFDFDELSQVVNNLLEPQSAFGLAHYLGPQATISRMIIQSSNDIMKAFECLRAFLSANRASNINDLLTALIEAVTNAVYHVNRLPDGSLKYEKGQPIERLADHEEVSIDYGRDSERIGIAIRDQGGRMSAEEVLYWLDRNISGAGLLDTHGRGMYLMHRLADRLLINIAPGERTEIIMLDYPGAQRGGNKPIYINHF
jgi:DNA-binding NarL/FixJ family response regulator